MNDGGGERTDESDEPSLDEMRAALDRLNETDPDWPDLQWYVADALHDRYLDYGDREDLKDAIVRGRRAVAAMTHSSPEHLSDLALFVWCEVVDFADGADLEPYLALLEQALALTHGKPECAELEARCQTNLAVGLMSRPDHTELDRDRAVSLWESAIESEALAAGGRATALANLAEALTDPDAGPEERHRAVQYGRRAVGETSVEAETAAKSWFALANALETAHDYGDNDGSLDEAIDAVRRGLRLLGEDHDDYPGHAVQLASLLRQRSHETGELEQLAEAVTIVREVALPKTQPEHPDAVFVFTMGAGVLSDLGYLTSDEGAVREAIGLYRRAVESSTPGSDERGVGLVNLAATLRDTADQFGAPDLLDDASDAGHAALRIFSGQGTRRASALTATGNSLRDRFITIGAIDDLRLAIQCAEEALDMTPERHRLYAARQTNLAVLLSDNYTESASLHDLDRAIDLYRDALESDELDLSRVAERQNDLALALRDRYKNSFDEDDLDEALQLVEHAVKSTDPQSPVWAGYANNYANGLAERYEIREDPADLDRAIQLFADALADARGRMGEESGYATNLGLALATRAEETGSVHDFDSAIRHLTQSIDMLSPDHPEVAYRTSNLAAVQRQKSNLLAQCDDRVAAIAVAELAVKSAHQAVKLAGERSAQLLPTLANLAQGLRWLIALDPERVDASDMLDVQRRAANLSEVAPAQKFGQSARWARDAQELSEDGEAMRAYRQAVGLTPDVVWIGLSVNERQALLDDMADALTKAVSFAIASGHIWEALSWADQVRSVLWRQGLLVRSVAAQRSDEDRTSLSELVTMAAALDHRPHVREHRRRVAHQEAADLRLRVPEPAAYEALRVPGTLVLLVPGEAGSTALLVQDTGTHSVVDLAEASTAELAQQVATLREACSPAGEAYDRWTTADELRARHRVFDCLEWLWDHVAAPILDGIKNSPTRSRRIWWSPVGEFALLPIHASGRYPRKTSQFGDGIDTRNWPCLADRAMCSYLPTILGPEPPLSQVRAAPRRLIYVSTDAATGTLGHSAAEFEAVRAALTTVEVTELLAQNATIDAVRRAIPDHRLLHVTAHGEAGDKESLQSGFRLADGVFSVSDLADCDVIGGELAVILACDSARGDVQLPNEALHVAGAAAQAGFDAVVAATMPLRDSSAVAVVTAIYEAVNRAQGDVGELVATSLHEAVARLRRDPRTGPDPLSWAPYAFFGWGL